MKTKTFMPELRQETDAYWRASNYLSGGQIYPYDNPLLKKLLKLSHVKPLVIGHWDTTPGSIHQAGELGCSLNHAFGAAFDNPDLIGACLTGEGGRSRHIDGTATPADNNRGTLKLWFTEGDRKMIFEPAHHFSGKGTAAVVGPTTETNLTSYATVPLQRPPYEI
jgi:hypothetical protein